MGESENNIAILGSTLLFVLYGITTIFCLVRTARLHKFSPDWKPSKGFYISLLVQCTSRSCCFLLLLVLNESTLNPTLVFLLLSVPDSMFIVSYILLLWQVLLAFTSAHTNTRSTIALFLKFFKANRYDKLSSYITFALTVWIGTQTCLYILVANKLIHFRNLSKEVGICNFSLAGSTVIGMIVLQIRFSGVPLRTETWRGKLNRINLVTGFWTFARVLQGILDILDQNKETSLSHQMSKSEASTLGNTQAAYLFSILIVSEIVCVLMVLDYAFMGIFVFSEDERENVQERRKVDLREISYESFSSIMNQSLQIRINMKDVCILCQINNAGNGLGKVYKATYDNREVFVRKITFSRLSTYVLEDFSQELDSYNSSHPNILPIIGVSLDLPIIYTISPLIVPGSLYKLLHIERRNLSFSQKVHYIKQIAGGLSHMHSLGKVHGHLTSHNIVVNSNDRVFITDFGMGKIKKYAGIVCGYCNKTAWSSPEVLADRRLTAVKTDFFDDVYSFGVIVWEIFTQSEPFEGLELEGIKELVVRDKERLEIPAEFSSSLCELLQGCWEEVPEDRLSFNEIISKLKKIN